MDSKKKMIIAISSCALVVIAVVIAVVAVLAAQTVTVKNSISIGYHAGSNVRGTVSGSWTMEDTSKSGNLTPVTFLGSEGTEEEKNKDGGNIKNLSFEEGKNTYLEVTFNFTNESALVDYTATLKSTTKGENVKILGKANDAADWTDISSTITTDNGPSIVVSKEGTGKYVLRIELNNALEDAAFDGDISWKLVGADRT